MRTAPSRLFGLYGKEPMLRADLYSLQTMADQGWIVQAKSGISVAPRVGKGLWLIKLEAGSSGPYQYAQLPVEKVATLHTGCAPDELTIVMEFIPYEEETERSSLYTLLDTDSTETNRTAIIRRGFAGSYTLDVYTGAATQIASIASATYGPYWVENEASLLVCSLKSGANNIYMNGVNIASNSTAWSTKPFYDIWLGEDRKLASYGFYGVITRFELWPRALTVAEVEDL